MVSIKKRFELILEFCIKPTDSECVVRLCRLLSICLNPICPFCPFLTFRVCIREADTSTSHIPSRSALCKVSGDVHSLGTDTKSVCTLTRKDPMSETMEWGLQLTSPVQEMKRTLDFFRCCPSYLSAGSTGNNRTYPQAENLQIKRLCWQRLQTTVCHTCYATLQMDCPWSGAWTAGQPPRNADWLYVSAGPANLVSQPRPLPLPLQLVLLWW